MLGYSVKNKYICTQFSKPFIEFKIMAYKINADLCTACGTCIDECPVEAISPGDVYSIDPTTCTDCGSCADVCPVEAINPE
jgi:NAD-dependent dihydropyrimidine dehydrogenase PreA subunit